MFKTTIRSIWTWITHSGFKFTVKWEIIDNRNGLLEKILKNFQKRQILKQNYLKKYERITFKNRLFK